MGPFGTSSFGEASFGSEAENSETLELVDGIIATATSPTPAWVLNVADGIDVTDTADLASLIIAAIERVTINSTQQNFAHLFNEVTEEVVPQAIANVVYPLVLVDGVTVSDSLVQTKRQLATAIELLSAAGVAQSTLHAINAVVVSMAAHDVARICATMDETETVDINALVVQQAKFWHNLVEEVLAEDTANPTSRFTVVCSETMAAAAEGQSFAIFLEDLTEIVAAFGTLVIDGEEHIAWVINTETTAAWKYTNFNFNSYTELKTDKVRYYGLRRDGLYLLEGANDAGDVIRASITFPKFDFNSTDLKTLGSAAWIAIKTDGSLVLKITQRNEDTGADETYWYRSQGRLAPTMREDKYKIGRGLESLFFKFTLANEAGADFEVGGLTFTPIMLKRKV
jgi:hypothetical protein